MVTLGDRVLLIRGLADCAGTVRANSSARRLATSARERASGRDQVKAPRASFLRSATRGLCTRMAFLAIAPASLPGLPRGQWGTGLSQVRRVLVREPRALRSTARRVHAPRARAVKVRVARAALSETASCRGAVERVEVRTGSRRPLNGSLLSAFCARWLPSVIENEEFSVSKRRP